MHGHVTAQPVWVTAWLMWSLPSPLELWGDRTVKRELQYVCNPCCKGLDDGMSSGFEWSPSGGGVGGLSPSSKLPFRELIKCPLPIMVYLLLPFLAFPLLGRITSSRPATDHFFSTLLSKVCLAALSAPVINVDTKFNPSPTIQDLTGNLLLPD